MNIGNGKVDDKSLWIFGIYRDLPDSGKSRYPVILDAAGSEY